MGMLDGLDGDLVAAAADGRREARERLLDVMQPRLRSMLWVRGGLASRQDLEELAQACLVALDRGLSRLETRSASGLRAYASGIVARLHADYCRRRGAADRRAPISLDDELALGSSAGSLLHTLTGTETSPSSAAGRKETLLRIRRALERMPRRRREAITLAFFDQLDTADVATRFGISREAASMLVLRALRDLRQRIAGGAAEADGAAGS